MTEELHDLLDMAAVAVAKADKASGWPEVSAMLDRVAARRALIDKLQAEQDTDCVALSLAMARMGVQEWNA